MLAEILLRFCLKHSFGFPLLSTHTDRGISFRPARLCALVGFLFFVMLLPGVLVAQTEVSGEVSGEWTAEGSPYILIDDTVIPRDEMLILRPGCTVRFNNNMRLDIHGEIQALGVEEDSVFIWSENHDGVTGFHFHEDASEVSLFEYCRVDTTMIRLNSIHVAFRNSLFITSKIHLDHSSGEFIENVFYTDDASFHISGSASDSFFESNIFNGGLLDFQPGARLTFINNHIDLTMCIAQFRELIFEGGFIRRFLCSGGWDLTITSCGITSSIFTNMENLVWTGDSEWDEETSITSVRNCRIEGIRTNSAFTLNGTVDVSIADCRFGRVRLSRYFYGRVENCEFENVSIDTRDEGVELEFIGNVVTSRCRVQSREILFENNHVEQLDVEEGCDRSSIFRNNRIYEHLTVKVCNPYFYGNDIGVWRDRITRRIVEVYYGSSPLFVNNTFCATDKELSTLQLIKVNHGSTPQFYNNLFLGMNSGQIGIIVGDPDESQVIGDYNIFWGLDTSAVNYEIGGHSQVINAHTRNRRVRDIRLLPNSPAIDAGSQEWAGRDPDGSPPDIGCYFFDSREDHPPFIEADFEQDADPFNELMFEVVVVDDGNEVNIELENLPEWLELEEEQDEFERHLTFRGVLPEDADEHFEFVVRAEDNSGQPDTLVIDISTSPYRILTGEIQGELLVEQSPYLVIGHVIVREGTELLIEPGAELLFRFQDDLFLSSRIIVRGSMRAVGTEQDTIIFRPEDPDLPHDWVDQLWQGVVLMDVQQDSSVFEYCHFSEAYHSIYASNSESIRISKSRFDNNFRAIYGENGSAFTISENHFQNNHGAVKLWSCDGVINNNRCIGFGIDDTSSSFGFSLQRNDYDVYNNEISDMRGLGILLNHNGVIHHNIIRSCNTGIHSGSHEFPQIYNNLIIENRIGFIFGIIYDNYHFALANNMFINCEKAIDCTNELYNPEECEVTHNLFFNNDINFDAEQLIQAGFGDITRLNANGDSCDAMLNLFTDPLFEDYEGGAYELTEFSPCRDAGREVGLPFGGEAPDMGAFEFDEINFVAKKPAECGEFKLNPTYPNPFNSITNISYTIPHSGNLSINLYDLHGRNITQELFAVSQAGRFSKVFDLSDYPTGVYFLEMAFDSVVKRQKLVLVR